MSCPDCFKNCGDKYTSDRCVEYTGEDIPALGICTGDSLSKVEAAIVESLLSALDGTGIKPVDVTLENCEWLACQLDCNTTNPPLNQLLQLLIDSQCTLKSLIDSMVEEPSVFDAKCLTGLPSNPSSVDILQATVNLICEHEAVISTLPTTYVKQSDLETMVLQIIQSNPAKVAFPKNVPVPYIGSLSNFDNTGKGQGDYLGWYIMNGLNGTQDWRGRKMVGAVRNVPGGSLDPSVDPAVQGSAVNYGSGDKFGSAFVKLTTNEIPPHNHSVTDPGHTHSAQLYKNDSSGGDQPNTAYLGNDKGAAPASINTISSTTNITIGSTGGGIAHENRDPSVAAIWIVQL